MANVTFKFLKKTNLEIGYCDFYSDDKTDFTLFENDEKTLNMTDNETLYFGIFGNDNDILTTPIIYIIVNGVTYSIEFYKNNTAYADTKYYLPICYYQKHYSFRLYSSPTSANSILCTIALRVETILPPIFL